MSVVVVMPSRGRPKRAHAAAQALRDTAGLIETSIIVAVDSDDPELEAYQDLRWRAFGPEVMLIVLAPTETGDLVRATNTVSRRVAAADPHAIIGNLGDDHVCRTRGWDQLVVAALATPGIAYGRDGLQDADLPTAPFISAEIVTALGYYALPDLAHLFIDNVWRDIGAQTGTLRYLPELFIEHCHPYAGKAEWDDGYLRVNAPDVTAREKARYESWREHAMSIDIGRVRAALA